MPGTMKKKKKGMAYGHGGGLKKNKHERLYGWWCYENEGTNVCYVPWW